MISSVDNVSFCGWTSCIKSILPRKLVGYSKHTPKMQPYREFQFMPELQTKNQIKKFFQNMIDNIKGIRKAMKPEQNSAVKSTGITFEA